jgi:hypothetical protein
MHSVVKMEIDFRVANNSANCAPYYRGWWTRNISA